MTTPPDHKHCTHCDRIKPLTDFYPKHGRKGFRSFCKKCDAKRSSAYTFAPRAYNRTVHLRKKYGISPADYDWMLADQDGACAICQVHQLDLTYRLHVDHDHNTGKVRGLLCVTCNTALGRWEKKGMLGSLIEYLTTHDSAALGELLS